MHVLGRVVSHDPRCRACPDRFTLEVPSVGVAQGASHSDKGFSALFRAQSEAEADSWVELLEQATMPLKRRVDNRKRVAAFFGGTLQPYRKIPLKGKTWVTYCLQAAGLFKTAVKYAMLACWLHV